MTLGFWEEIEQEEREHEKDILADWMFVAEGKRRLRQELANCLWGENNKLADKIIPTLDDLKNIQYIYTFDTESNKILYYMPEEDENWETIVDTENKRVKFIDSKTWKVIYREYV